MKECARLQYAVGLARELRSTMCSAALDNASDPLISAANTYAMHALTQACNALASARARCSCGAVACSGVSA